MPLDIQQIVNDSIAAAKDIIGKGWKDVKPFAQHEFTQYAEDVEHLIALKTQGIIGDDEFKARIDLLNTGIRSIFLAIKGIGILQVQNIVNALIGIVSKAVLSVFNIPFL